MFIQPQIFKNLPVTAGFSFNSSISTDQNDFEKKLIGKKNKKMIFLKQKHTDKVALFPGSNLNEPFDAVITRRKEHFLFLRTADCNPILFYEENKKVIGVIHAGWRGLKQKIFTKTILKAQEKYNIDVKKLKIAVGPSIRVCCYEVKEDLIEEFSIFENHQELFTHQGSKIYFDQIKTLEREFEKLDIPQNNIEIIDQCTYCAEGYFSYRKNKTDMRNISFIGME